MKLGVTCFKNYSVVTFKTINQDFCDDAFESEMRRAKVDEKKHSSCSTASLMSKVT